jgi:hypothetical protein
VHRVPRDVSSRILLFGLIATLLGPDKVSSQDLGVSSPQTDWVARELGALGANALIGALSSGLTAVFRGEDVRGAALSGAFGGSLSYLGKKVVATRKDGSGLAGRAIASIGHSAIVNGGNGKRPFARYWIPFGPLVLSSHPTPEEGRVQVNLRTAVMLVYAVLAPELVFDTRRSLLQGAPVFVADGSQIYSSGRRANGVEISTVVLLSGVGVEDPRRTLAHETIHVIQSDFLFQAWSRPVESYVRNRIGLRSSRLTALQPGLFAPAVQRFLDFGEVGSGVLSRLRETEARLWFDP